MPYCERINGGPGLLGEPVNAATNAVVFVAAGAAWYLGNRRKALSGELWVLIGLSVAVGIGSTLWHTFETPWAHHLDVYPILLFQLSFIWTYGRRLAKLSWWLVALILVV